MTHILETIEAEIKQRKAREAQQIAIAANARVRAQKFYAIIAQSKKEKPCSE